MSVQRIDRGGGNSLTLEKKTTEEKEDKKKKGKSETRTPSTWERKARVAFKE